jgi:hypothetical protein
MKYCFSLCPCLVVKIIKRWEILSNKCSGLFPLLVVLTVDYEHRVYSLCELTADFDPRNSSGARAIVCKLCLFFFFPVSIEFQRQI